MKKKYRQQTNQSIIILSVVVTAMLSLIVFGCNLPTDYVSGNYCNSLAEIVSVMTQSLCMALSTAHQDSAIFLSSTGISGSAKIAGDTVSYRIRTDSSGVYIISWVSLRHGKGIINIDESRTNSGQTLSTK